MEEEETQCKIFAYLCDKCFILNDLDARAKFEPKSEEEIFQGYSPNIRVYRVYNKKTKTIMESANIVVDNKPEDHSDFFHLVNIQSLFHILLRQKLIQWINHKKHTVQLNALSQLLLKHKLRHLTKQKMHLPLKKTKLKV